MLYATLEDAWNRPTNLTTISTNNYKSPGITTTFNRFKDPNKFVLETPDITTTPEVEEEHVEMFEADNEEFLIHLLLFVMILILLD
jgi:hypothetical protein